MPLAYWDLEWLCLVLHELLPSNHRASMLTSIELREGFEYKAVDHVQLNQLSVFVKRRLRPPSWAKAIDQIGRAHV